MSSETKNLFLDRYLTPIAVLIGAMLIAGALYFGNSAPTSAPGAPGEAADLGAEAVAKSLGLDTKKLAKLVEQKGAEYQQAVTADMEEGNSFGIQGTPGSITGKQLIPGAYPLEMVLAAINGEPLPAELVARSAEVQESAAVPHDIATVRKDTGPSIGNADAPKTLAVWFDFQCGFCKKFEAETLTVLEESLVKNGELRIVYKDFQFLSPKSNTAALYSRAVWEAHPDRWHEWYKAMMSQ